MFGSLVVIFPTEHVGGDLTLRFKGTAWTFESSKMLSNKEQSTEPGPRLAWVAFYSDIEHEVSLVESGYRVSLTYNLYYSKDKPSPPLPSIVPSPPEEAMLKGALMDLLSSPLVLPEGGALGFGLTYQYPIVKDIENRHQSTSISSISDRLKGTDALVKRVCTELGLKCHVKALYDLYDEDWGEEYGEKVNVYLTDKAYGDGRDEEYMGEYMDEAPNLRVIGAFAGKDSEKPVHSTRRGWRQEEKVLAPVVRVLWATPANKLTTVETTVVTYGNEPGVGWFYAPLVLVAMIPSYEARGASGVAVATVA
ncbi:hypothetical protein NMY22_g9590 [Coprinellus aureogranulatus]|nr:hypothetical protein NMY22_g9590 [Coprinellus aureogranulatus]